MGGAGAPAERLSAALADLRSGADGQRSVDHSDPGEWKVAGQTRRGSRCHSRTDRRLARAQIAEWLQGKEPKKVIYVEKKLMNFVV